MNSTKPARTIVRAPSNIRLLRPAQPQRSQATIDRLRSLLRQAESGKLIGLAYVAMHSGHTWDYHCAGETQRDKAWTLGMLQAFATKLAWDINDPE